MMNNYDEIARQAVNKVLKKTSLHTLETLLYKCAYEAARLQAERFNKDLDDSYIEYLSKEELY